MSIADRITSMSNNLSSAYDGIEYLGVDTTGVDKNLQNLSSMLNVVYEGLPKVSDEGVSPSIDGSRVGRLKSTLKASDTTQGSTTGKNLLPYPYKNTTKTDSGITWTDNNDGTITVDGTNNSSSTVYFTCVGSSSPFGISLIAGTYTISLGVASNVRCTCAEYENIQNVVALINAGSSKTTFTLSEDKVVTFALAVNAGLSVDNVKIRPMLVSGTDDTYEPYTGGIPSPNPNYPQNIHVVKGNNTVEVCGKNLYNGTYSAGKGINSSGNEYSTTGQNASKYIPVQPNTTYTLFIPSNIYTLARYKSDKTFITRNLPSSASSYTFTTSEDCYYIRFSGYAENWDKTQLELGSEATTSEPYTGTTYPINLPVQNLFDKDNADIKNWLIGNTNHNIDTSSVNERSIVVSVKPNTTYTISKMVTNRFRIGESSQYPQAGDILNNYVRDESGETSITITTLSNTNYLVINIVNVGNTAYNLQDTLDSIQIEPGNKANRYTPYGVAPIELCKINTYQDKLFKAIVGDTIYDTLTSEQKEGLVSGGWYKYGEAGKYVANNDLTNNGATDYFVSLITPALNVPENLSGTEFETISKTNLMATRANSVYTGYSGLNGTTSARKIRVTLSKNYCTDVPTANTFLTNNNFTIYFPFETPEITPITDSTLISQLEALYKAQSKNGQTNVLQTNADNPFVIYASALKAS